VNDPMVLFLDEPTLGFDPRGQREVLDIIKDISRKRGTSVIISTHFLEAVEHVCTRAIILSKGRVIADGSVADIKHHVRAPRVGRFQVPPGMHDRVLGMLEGLSVTSGVRSDGTGSFLVTVEEGTTGAQGAAERAMNAVIAALVRGEVPRVSFSLESASLSDAFIQLTEEAAP
jgi:ABC-2 type transport system ATP-binding protein